MFGTGHSGYNRKRCYRRLTSPEICREESIEPPSGKSLIASVTVRRNGKWKFELMELIAWAKQHSVRRLIVNGSFVTEKQDPNDVDVVLLPSRDERRQEMMFEGGLTWPFLQILIAADDADLERWAADDFATDRNGCPKGVVEVILW